LGKNGLDGQQEPHLLRLENAPLWIHEWDTCPGIHEARPQFPCGQVIVGLTEPPDSVTVLQTGFDYQGRSFASLSAVARQITGSRWNGPAFFGLRERRL
jgi:hypothetical protein